MVRRGLALVAVLLLATSTYAEQIAVKNASFEDPVQGPGGWTNTLPDWTGPVDASQSFIEYITGFSADGVNHLGIQTGFEVSQDLGISLTPNTTYTLTVGVGRRNASFTAEGNESRYGLYLGGDATSGGTLLADAVFDASPLTDSTFVDQTLSFTSGAAVDAGNLFVSLRSTGPGRAHYDNIRLTAVPEPATWLLGSLGLLGLALRGRRR
jgi:hypothetical protein